LNSSASVPQSGESGVEARQDENALASRVRLVGLTVAIFVGLVESVLKRHTMSPDGISYLDIGDAMFRRDWAMAINAYWSPLYPFLQGLALKLFRPSAYMEFTVVHVVNFLIYLFALACFDLLLQAAVAIPVPAAGPGSGRTPLPRWAVFAVGYAVFVWSSYSLITIWKVAPDMLMAAFVYLGMALLLRIWLRPSRLSVFFALGAVLGFGYLAKAPMFPLSLLMFVAIFVVVRDWRRTVPGVLIAVLTFAALTGPFVLVISKAKGRFTIGDSGRINLLWVNGAGPTRYFQILGTAGGHYKHPIRKVFDAPPIYEFATPIKGTIPAWTDPSYWADGAVPRMHPKQELALIISYAIQYLEMIFTAQAALFVGFVVLCLWCGRGLLFRQILARWPVWLMGVIGLGMYSLVSVELQPRYTGAFFILFWLGLYSGLAIPAGADKLRVVSLVTLAVALAMLVPVGLTLGPDLVEARHGIPNQHWQAAEAMRRLGLKPGDKIGRIGGHPNAGWARLLGVSIVAELPMQNAREFWCAQPERQKEVIEAFHRLGVNAVVAEQVWPAEIQNSVSGWSKSSNGEFYVRRFVPLPGDE
jgi:hypothetical protein